jgi:DNA-binding transcriptional ArsR family regulator
MSGPGFKAPDALPNARVPMKVELDKRSLFALASDTRLEMLKALQTNRRTVSQLAELLNIDKAAIHRHLKKLEEGGFVVRTEDHGFVYYALTWRSRDILNPNDKTRIVILLSSALVCVLAMVVIMFLAATPRPVPQFVESSGSEDLGPTMVDGSSSEAPSSGNASLEAWTIAALVLFGGLAGSLAVLAWRSWRMPHQRGGEDGSDRQAGSDDRGDISEGLSG